MRRRVLPRGSGGVRCVDCSARAVADGKGSPIVLRHEPECPSLRPVVVAKNEVIERLGVERAARFERWVEFLSAYCDLPEEKVWTAIMAIGKAQERMFMMGEQLLYSYDPGDGRGVRYVFKNRTCIGLDSARSYVSSLLVDAPH
jgi:hypothetical protein